MSEPLCEEEVNTKKIYMMRNLIQNRVLGFAAAISFCAVVTLNAAELPNILWITSEDNGAEWLGCYGNEQAETPRLDSLAEEGFRFEHVYSNAPVCAVARSTILRGAYAVTTGTHHMRSRHPIPERFKAYVTYLRDKGYYCTNASKTDYNFAGNDKRFWDDCSGRAHYKNRPDEVPFFAVMNLTVSHESSLFKFKKQPAKNTRIAPSEVKVPPYLPDLPEIRADIAAYHDIVTEMDRQVGKILDELDKAGLAENTIVFYYSDHGGVLPRGKRYLLDSGVRVPMMVRVPEAFHGMSPFKVGEVVAEPVSFVDLAPTVLSLAGIEKPNQMQGRVLLGSQREEPAVDEMEFLYGDRFDEIYGMRRGLTDGKWKYIRRFVPRAPAAPYSIYQFGQAGWSAWRDAWKAGKLEGRFASIWEGGQAVEELYDLEADPWEVSNLAGDPTHRARLESMRAKLRATMVQAGDTGIVPEPMFASMIEKHGTVADAVEKLTDYEAALDMAFLGSAAKAGDLEALKAGLTSNSSLVRYWAAQGCLNLGTAAESSADALTRLLGDDEVAVALSASEALVAIGSPAVARSFVVKVLREAKEEYSALHAANIVRANRWVGDLPAEWFDQVKKSGSDYLKRMAVYLKEGEAGQ